MDSGCVVVVVAEVLVAEVLVEAIFFVVAVCVAGPRSLDASVAIAAGFGTPLPSACGFADGTVAGLLAAAAATAITIKNSRIITTEILRRVASASTDGTTCLRTR
jgi:hypothetical protein